MMRVFFQENDLVSGEIQSVHKDGSVSMQTRNLKYGKVTNCINLVKKWSFDRSKTSIDI
jgi:exosome complex RNA-binding protein Rrp4